MNLPTKFLDEIIKETEKKFTDYKRTPYLTEIDLIKEVSDLYENKKQVILLNSLYDIRNTLSLSNKPWVYHVSLNLNWVVFFNHLYKKMSLSGYVDKDNKDDLESIYIKTNSLELVLNHIDGIIEDDNKIYLVKDDFNFINPEIKKWKI